MPNREKESTVSKLCRQKRPPPRPVLKLIINGNRFRHGMKQPRVVLTDGAYYIDALFKETMESELAKLVDRSIILRAYLVNHTSLPSNKRHYYLEVTEFEVQNDNNKANGRKQMEESVAIVSDIDSLLNKKP